MRKNVFAAGVLHQTPLGELTALPRPSSWIFRRGKEWGREGEGRANLGEGKGGCGRSWCDLGKVASRH